MSRNTIFALIYNRRKFLDLIYFWYSTSEKVPEKQAAQTACGLPPAQPD
jgi:hypothetical protein